MIKWSWKWTRCYKTGYFHGEKMLKGENRSDYSKYLPRQFIRNRLKIEKRCQFVLEKFFNVKMHVFFMFFISRLKMHARCVSSPWVWVWGENYLGTSPAVWEHRYLCYESGAGVWSEGSLLFRVMANNLSHRFCLDSATMSQTGRPYLGNFFASSWNISRGSFTA